MRDETKDIRLPPPAFPPGSRKHVQPAVSREEPLPGHRPEEVSAAFISPDDPFPSREGGVWEEEGIVTDMGDDPHLAPEELVSAGDPYVIEITGAISRLAETLQQKGEAALRASPETGRFEATLRAYCAGYLAGCRAVDEADLRDYEPFMGFDS